MGRGASQKRCRPSYDLQFQRHHFHSPNAITLYIPYVPAALRETIFRSRNALWETRSGRPFRKRSRIVTASEVGQVWHDMRTTLGNELARVYGARLRSVLVGGEDRGQGIPQLRSLSLGVHEPSSMGTPLPLQSLTPNVMIPPGEQCSWKKNPGPPLPR